MKFLCLAVLTVTLLQVNGFLFKSKTEKLCDKYSGFENKAIACMMKHEAAFQSKDVKLQCSAYRESSKCMVDLQKTMKQCGFMPPVDVYEQMTGWQHLLKTDLCSRAGY